MRYTMPTTATTRLAPALLSAVALGLATASSSATALTTLQFAPGQANGGTNTHYLSSGGADLDSLIAFNQFQWAAVGAVGDTVGTPWMIVIDDGDDDSFDPGDPITESFAFHLETSKLGLGSPNVYGTPTFPGLGGTSHVYMTASLVGVVATGNGLGPTSTDLGSLKLNYTGAEFDMFFDADGDLSDLTDATKFASFGATPFGEGESGVADGSTATTLATLQWTVNFNSALPGTFADENGNEIASGTPDGDGLVPVSNSIEPTLFKVTRQAIELIPEGTGTLPIEDMGEEMGYAVRVRSSGSATGTSEFATPTPEPGTLALVGLGVLGLGASGIARRRRRVAS